VTAAAVVYEAPSGVDLARLEDALFTAFSTIREALEQDQSVVVVVRDEDLLGHAQPADAALAGALVGLTRALATEGARAGWRINAIAVTADVDPIDQATWISHLSESPGLNGELVRLGPLHLGRVPV
jgi:NAD(P)-dependent dehydrogenase (short-subunit alcohol dehydrogenase family)